ncbi:ABC transporter permease subunit [Miniphocaeibacter massiliensis]|uniref:ABC transporter permease subunit n=1 Tax=Miniphocaeibacter massiliensis TaxID=2041841 RepID=UPI000C1C2656|nr:ABC transporter permease subunit [Miniphocaeibacter massiliensis]
MTIFKHEMKQGFKALAIWTFVIGGMLSIALLIFPDMTKGMGDSKDLFSNMGDFTAAFGMDKINFGTVMGFYGIECGNILGIGGGFFAAFLGISILSKEEKNGTAEFLLTHPIKRFKVIFEKLLSVLVQILILNIVVIIFSVISFKIIGEKIELQEFSLMHLAYLILQIEISFICFGISAFLRDGTISIGLGLATVLYFMNIIKNISEKAEILKYITPFSYTEVGDILVNTKLDINLIFLGVGYSIVAVVIGFIKYIKKDIYV